MNYSLGNTLSRGGSLNADGLSLDLQFATDKSLTARKGPTPVFTRASTATFVGSNGLIQSAAINQARFDHDPSTLVSKGLLIEESRTNNVTRSQDMNLWSGAGGSTRAVSTENSPDGTTKATLASGGASGFGDIAARSLSSLTSVIGTSYTVSCFVKKINYRYVCVDYSPIRLGGSLVPFFDLDTLVFNANGSTVTGSITSYPNGWYRLTVSGAAVRLETPTVDIILCSATGSAGSSRSGEQIYLWGAQLEVAAFPTSYIPTTTSSVVRSADVCSITGSDFTGFYNQSAGTLVEAFEASPNTNTTYVSASNGNIVQNSVHLDNDTGLMRAVYYSGSSLVATLDLGSVGTVGTVNKIATAYSVNDFAASRNGGTVVTDTSGAVPVSLSQINIGADERSQTPTSFYSNRCIKSLRYYKKRLANAKLQTLST